MTCSRELPKRRKHPAVHARQCPPWRVAHMLRGCVRPLQPSDFRFLVSSFRPRMPQRRRESPGDARKAIRSSTCDRDDHAEWTGDRAWSFGRGSSSELTVGASVVRAKRYRPAEHTGRHPHPAAGPRSRSRVRRDRQSSATRLQLCRRRRRSRVRCGPAGARKSRRYPRASTCSDTLYKGA